MMSTPSEPRPQELRSVAGRLNALQDLDGRDAKLNELSQKFTNTVFILLRSAGLYDLDNKALDQPYDEALRLVSELYALLREPLSLRALEGNVFLNRRQVKLDFSTFQNVRALIKAFEHLGVNELFVEPEVTRADLAALLSAFVKVVKERRGVIGDYSVPHVRFRKLKIGEVHPLLKDKSAEGLVCAWYAQALADTRAFYLDAAAGRAPRFSALKRVALTLVDLPRACAPLLSCAHLLAPEVARGTLPLQSVEAAALCVALSLALDLSPEVTSTLAAAALQAFQGWTLLEQGAISPDDKGGARALFERLSSPQLGDLRRELTRRLLDLGGVSEAVIQRVVIAYEAQRAPTPRATSAATLPSRASRREGLYPGGLAQSFLTDLVYGAHLYVHLRHQTSAARAMLALSGAGLSPLTLSAFERALGRFPVGSPVTLSDGGVALVSQSRRGVARVVARVALHAGRASLGEVLTIRESSPIQVSGEGTLAPSLCAPLVFSRRKAP
jgi:hypothetical protein